MLTLRLSYEGNLVKKKRLPEGAQCERELVSFMRVPRVWRSVNTTSTRRHTSSRELTAISVTSPRVLEYCAGAPKSACRSEYGARCCSHWKYHPQSVPALAGYGNTGSTVLLLQLSQGVSH